MKDITQEERKIYALYDNNTIRVYQAYNAEIAEEALKLGTFGSHFSLTRMTWIKPSFLWMMYRCGWAEKENQERVLAIDIKREAFDVTKASDQMNLDALSTKVTKYYLCSLK